MSLSSLRRSRWRLAGVLAAATLLVQAAALLLPADPSMALESAGFLIGLILSAVSGAINGAVRAVTCLVAGVALMVAIALPLTTPTCVEGLRMSARPASSTRALALATAPSPLRCGPGEPPERLGEIDPLGFAVWGDGLFALCFGLGGDAVRAARRRRRRASPAYSGSP